MSGNAMRASAIAVPGLLLVAALMGCSKQDPGAIGQNLPPETSVSFASDSGDTTACRVHLRWSGSDTDGEVALYLIRWGTEEWSPAVVTDSVFVLDRVDDSDSLAAYAAHTFAVKAVDDDGAEDPTPAVISFTSRNVFPETEIIHGPEGVTGPMVCFEWRGWDYDGVVVGYGYKLFRYESAEWVEIAGQDSVPPDEYTLALGPLAGTHRFDVWSIDDMGTTDPTPAQREFICNPELIGPQLTIETNVLGEHSFRGPAWGLAYDECRPVFEGDHLVFDWSAVDEAGTCGIVGFSHAFDDTSSWCESFSMEDTHFEVTPSPGEHSLYVAVLGAANDITRARLCVSVIEVSLDDYILVVDDYDHFEFNPNWGTDEDRDAFYDSLAAGYGHPVVQWDCTEHLLYGAPQPADVEAMAGASTVIWYCDQDATIHQIYDSLHQLYDRLGGYIRVGGNLVLIGFEVLGQITEEPYPIALSAEDTEASRVFIRDRLGIGYATSSGAAANKSAPWTYGYCFYGAVPGATGIPDDRMIDLEPMYIDSVGPGGYPEPGKWWPYTWDEPSYSRCGLGSIEAVTPYDGHPIEAFQIDAFLNMNYEGATCCLLRPTGSGNGNVCYFGFPLYYLQTDQVRAVFDDLLPMFGEERTR